jgi:hypothetical protein
MTGIENSRPWTTTWEEVLRELSSLSDSDMVCFDRSGPTELAEECLVADSYDLAEDEDLPSEASERGWNASLLKEQIEDIVENVRLQVGEASTDLTLNAIRFYLDNDAFIVFD